MLTLSGDGSARGERSNSMSSGDQSLDDVESKFSPSDPSGGGKKLCRVCGDKAFSVNFNVVTCESCKAFFRRNALKPKEFRCPLNGRCQINVVTRRQCKKCRLEKCFQVGMVKDFIMTDEARMRKRHLIEENRAKRRMVIERKLYNHGSSDLPAQVKCENADAGSSDLHCSFGYYDPTPFDTYTPMDAQFDTPPPSGGNEKSIRDVNESGNSGDTINVPKSVLIALINQCHKMRSDGQCPHALINSLSDMNGTRMTKGSKSPMICTCRCLCGASDTPNWSFFPSSNGQSTSPTSGDTTEWSLEVKEGGDHSKEMVIMPHKELLRVLYSAAGLRVDTGGDQYLMRFDYGVSASKCSHFDRLKLWFEVMYDRWKDDFNRDHECRSITYYQPESEPDPVRDMAVARRIPMPALLERYDNLIRRLVKLCRRMMALKYVNVKDQISLIKGALMELMALRAVHAYIPESDSWRHTEPFGEPTPCKILKFKGEHAYRVHLDLVTRFPRRYVYDDNIFLTMVAMVLFTPDRPGLIDKDAVRLIREFYHNMLRQYLISTYGDDVGPQMLDDVVRIVDRLRVVAPQFVWRMVVELDSSGTEPLLIDIIDRLNNGQ